MDDGYVCPPSFPQSRGNVAFFPGYPVTGWLVRRATGWPTPISLLVAAQLAAWGYWTYVFLLLRQWRVPGRLAVLGLVLLASRPAVFFLVTAYSEPLFLMSLLGFLYWSGAKSRAAPFLAALHGFVLTATRISGLPIVVYPVLHAWLNAPGEGAGGRWKNAVRLLPPLAVAAFAALGVGLFLLFCQVRFGYWDLYMRTQFLGWRVQPDYLAFLERDTYLLLFPTSLDDYLQSGYFSRISTFLLLPVFAAFLVAEYRWARSAPATGWRERAGIYFAAWMVYYLSVSGTSRLGLVSMARYVLVPEELLMLCLIHMLSRTAVRRAETPADVAPARPGGVGDLRFRRPARMHVPHHARLVGRLSPPHPPAAIGLFPLAPPAYTPRRRDGGTAARRKSIPGREKRWPIRRGRSSASTPTLHRPAKQSPPICDCPLAISTPSWRPAACRS